MYRSSSLVYWVMLCMSWYSCREKEISDDLDQQIEDVLSGLSLEEKVGQLNQLRGKPTTATNSKDAHFDLDEEIRKGRVGTFLNVHPLEDKMRLQKIAVEESSHGIPLIFAIDILHGFRTNFPVPLGEAASWDVEGIERSARIAAVEGSAVGFMWTMAPMVDISFDARWGRVMEGAGEDPYLGSLIAQARIRGFQGEDLAAPNTILACAKHFAGYGQVLAGRDYNQTWVSKRFLHDYVFPPFKAAADAGVASFMSAFTDFDGLPANISSYLLDDVLRKEWQYKGAVISDFNAIEELVEWRVAASRKEAAKLALTAGNDIDMMGLVFIDHLAELVREGRVPEQKIDDAVRRVLRLKFQLGLFDDPYRYFTPGLDEKVWLTDDHRRHAREIASSSMVLLKNDENILPLKASKYPKIAVIGTTDSNPMNLMGTWSAWGKTENVVSIVEGIKTKVGFGSQVVFARGCEDEDSENPALLSEALRVAKSSDLIILTLGEGWRNSGENSSLVDISLPDNQKHLAQEIAALGKPVVVVLFNGRPVVFPWIADNMSTILEAWIPGTEAGNALADVLFGTHNPSGKLPMTFPRSIAQVPISYMEKSTGRPYKQGKNYTRYLDGPNEPAYPFGYGLSYTSFSYESISLDQNSINMKDTLAVTIQVVNEGPFDGGEVVQLYYSDLVSRVTRPMRQLVRFQKVFIPAGASQEVIFHLTSDDLRYWNDEMKFEADPGKFELYVGGNSDATKRTQFELL